LILNTDLLFQSAFDAHQRGELKEAQMLYEQTLSLNKNHFDALHLLGVLAHQINKPKHAVALIGRAIELNPGISVVHNNFGLALQASGEFERSISAFNKSIELQALNPDAYFNKANSLAGLRLYEDALNTYAQSINQNPNFAPAFNNRGNVHQELNHLSQALEDYSQAMKIDSNYDEAFVNQGIVLQELGRFKEALLSYNHALKLNPSHVQANWNKSLLLLLMGDYAEGLKLYEWRWQRNNSTTPKRIFKEPKWTGRESLVGKKILVHGEQGLGDSIQFCRLIRNLANLGATVILEDEKALEQLLSPLEGLSQFIARGNPLPHFDFHSPLLSLPLALEITYETLPSPVPYLRAEAEKVNYWRSRLGPKTKPRIGICWSSVSTFQLDRKRSMSFEEFSKALPIAGFEFICLQKETKPSDLASLALRADIRSFGPELYDLSDTAALISCLDCVVSTCTSIPHLSAALGVDTVTLLSMVPDWRWGLDSSSTNFYNCMKLLRQHSYFDWDKPLQEAKNIIMKHLHD